MPFARIFLRPGTPPEYRKALGDGVHRAMVEAIAIPPDDRFLVISEHAGSDLTFDPQYLGVHRSNRFVLVQITMSVGRKPQQKENAIQTDSRNPRGGARPAAPGFDDRSCGNGVGKLVVRQRRSSIHAQVTARRRQQVLCLGIR